MWQKFTENARSSILRAQNIAVERKHGSVTSAHLFLGVLEVENDENSDVSALLRLSGVSRAEAILYAQSALESDENLPESEPKLTRGAKRILEWAADEARRQPNPNIETAHLFIACLRHQRDSHVSEVLRPLGLDAAQLREHLRGLHNQTPHQRGNPLNHLTKGSEKAIEAAHGAMRASFCGRIGAAHLLLGILENENSLAVETLRAAGLEIEELRAKTRELIRSDGEIARPQKRFSAGAKLALERAHANAKAGGFLIGPEDLLLGLLESDANWREKWKFRGEKLDCVAGLWTSEQAAALRGEFAQENPGALPTFNKPPLPRYARVCFAGGFLNGFALYFFIQDANKSVPGATAFAVLNVTILSVSAFVFCTSLFFGTAPRVKEISMNIFMFWFVGIITGSWLFTALDSLLKNQL